MWGHRCPGDDCRVCEREAERLADDVDYDSWQIGQDRYERSLDAMWER